MESNATEIESTEDHEEDAYLVNERYIAVKPDQSERHQISTAMPDCGW